MLVRLSNEYFIEQIPYNYVLKQSTVSYGSGDKVSNKPKLVEKDCGYYGTFGEAVKGYLKLAISEKTQDFVSRSNKNK